MLDFEKGKPVSLRPCRRPNSSRLHAHAEALRLAGEIGVTGDVDLRRRPDQPQVVGGHHTVLHTHVTGDVVEGKAAPDSDLIFLGANGPKDLDRLRALQQSIQPKPAATIRRAVTATDGHSTRPAPWPAKEITKPKPNRP